MTRNFRSLYEAGYSEFCYSVDKRVNIKVKTSKKKILVDNIEKHYIRVRFDQLLYKSDKVKPKLTAEIDEDAIMKHTKIQRLLERNLRKKSNN